jgi:hypothetical protein
MKYASEKAMALADGQLPPEEAPELVQELYHKPALVAELQAYLAMKPARLAQPYQAMARTPAPDSLIDTIMNYKGTESRAARSSPFSAIQGLFGRLKQTYDVTGWSLVGRPALAGTVVALCAWLLMPTSSVGAYVDANLGPALDKAVSGVQAPLVAVAPILSFKNKSAELCRQYDLVFSERQASHAVACRDGAGQWNVVMSTPLTSIGKATSAGPISRKPVDDYVSANSVEDLSLEREAEALRKGS